MKIKHPLAAAVLTLPMVTTLDRRRLGTLVERLARQNVAERRHLEALLDEVDRAQPVEPENVPAEIVTMNTTVRLHDDETEEDETYTLTYPERANIGDNRVSVLAPMGTALLGARVGDDIEWDAPAGKVKLRLAEILFQPEAAGRFDM
ncbi:MAG: nucleoside diphosphate kinase regulator [Pirellulales bacterium]|nr:nucleoside diphosphate kinase regulator [Pirellulales bacterium]